MHNSHIDILNIVNNDANLAGVATNADGVMGFLQAPQGLGTGITAATAAMGTFADLGIIFNDAANQLIGGFNTANAAVVQNAAAASQMHANAADVGGNNIPITGGTYNGDGTTIAQVLTTAVPTATAVASATTMSGTPAAAAPAAAPASAATAVSHTAAVEMSHSAPADMSHHDMSQHLHHMWG